MTSLRVALERFRPEFHGGGGYGSPRGGPIEDLRTDLQSALRGATNAFYLYLAMLTVIFVGAIGLIAVFRESPSTIQAIFAASGLSLPGVLFLMNRAWKDKVTAGILIATVSIMSEKDLRRLTDDLWRRWYGKDNLRRQVRPARGGST